MKINHALQRATSASNTQAWANQSIKYYGTEIKNRI